MTAVVPAAGAILDGVLEATWPIWHDGLSRVAYGQFHVAQLRTAWARRHQRQLALVQGADLLASATRYELAAVLDGRPVQVCGIGAVFTEPAHRGHGHAHLLIERLLDDATRSGAALALMFCDTGVDWLPPSGFEIVPTREVLVEVAAPARYGAPMTMIRSGEARDFAAVVAMGRTRAAPFRFSLDRDEDLVQHAVTSKRLLAGLARAGARQLHFFIAEEGITAAAYVVVSITGDAWTLEECGDRDPTGARVGAILQALVAREPAERRPTIRAWLPPHFAPPQLTLTPHPSSLVMMARRLGPVATPLDLAADDVLYWRNDVF
jgi:GNAT superfamily N-acetyltransferase